MHDDELVGIWSNDLLYGPGAQSDDVLILMPDGSGRLEAVNFVLCSAEFFIWSCPAFGKIQLRGTKCLEPAEDMKSVVEVKPKIPDVVASYRIDRKLTPSGKLLSVLSIQGIRALAPAFNVEEFGLCRRDFVGVENPSFTVE